jgi:hypothetical protein
MAWCMLKVKGLPGYFWGEAVSTAVHILHRALTRALDGKTQYEAWHGEVPTVTTSAPSAALRTSRSRGRT